MTVAASLGGTSPPRPIGFGIYGPGMIAGYHARAIAQIAGARLVAVAGRSAERAADFALRHGADFVGGGMEELAARPEVDVICVTTSAGMHLAPALIAIRAGKHVVIEKPMEIATARCDQMLTAAEAAGVWLVPIFQGRFGAGAAATKAAVAAGRLGRLVLASAYVKWHRTPLYYTGTRGSWAGDGGGALMSQAIHALDLLQWFVGLPAEVFCRTTRRVHREIEVEDTAVATLRYADGALGTVEATTAAWPGWQRRIELCGDQGSITLEDDRIARWDFREERPEDPIFRTPQRGGDLGSGASAPDAIDVEGHRRQLQDLVEALCEGRSPAVSGRSGRDGVALVEALYASAARKVPVRLYEFA